MENTVLYKDIMDVLENKDDKSTAEFNGVEITVNKTLTMVEMIEFIEFVVSICFDESGYKPEYKRMAENYAIIKYYTNIELPGNVTDCYELLIDSNLINYVTAEIDKYQFKIISDAIEDKVSYVIKSRVAEMSEHINELYHLITDLEEKFSNIFSGVNEESVQNMINALSNSDLDADSIARAIVEEKY